MKIVALLTVTLFLFSCASVSQKQSLCEAQFTKFSDVVSCTKNHFVRDPRAKDNAAFKLYILKGEQLAQMIEQGKLTELDARVEWQELYLTLKNKEGEAAQRAFNNWNATRVKSTQCVPIGNAIQCNSY